MRDIRDDLQDRANLIAEQISTAQGQFDKHIEQLRHEHETMLEDLRSTLHSVHMVIGVEGRRLGVHCPELKRSPRLLRRASTFLSRRNRNSRFLTR